MIELAAFAASHGSWVLRNRFSLNASLAQCDMQRSIPRLILEATATAAMVFLLLYVLFGLRTYLASRHPRLVILLISQGSETRVYLSRPQSHDGFPKCA